MIPTWGASAGFNVFSLFANGEQGAWYDPSDFSSLYQDAAGTTPVTAVEQAVGLMLDKRLGLPLGTQLVVNPTFATDSDWTKGTGWSIGSGVATKVAGSAANLSQPMTLVAGTTYRVVYTLTVTAGSVTAQFVNGSTVSGTARSASGTFVDFLTAASGNDTFQFNANATFAGTVDDVYIRPVSGNDAVQGTSTARPILRARYNQIVSSENLTPAGGVWSANNVIVSTDLITAPDGTLTADKLIANTVSGTHTLSGFASALMGVWSVYAKKAEYDTFRLNVSTSGTVFADYNLSTGVVIATGGTAFISASIEPVGDGWFRCTVRFTPSTSSLVPNLVLRDNAGSVTFAGNDVDGVYFWGAQSLLASDFSTTGNAYQRITTATNYATTSTMGGYQFLPYLSFDGVDDAMVTQSVNLSATAQATAWTGVTKFSTTTQSIIETGSSFTGQGNFGLLTTSTQYYSAFSGTTSGGTFFQCLAATYNNPTTNTFSALFDLTGTTNTTQVNAKVNGVAGTQTFSGTFATGLFASRVFNIGSRNGTGQFFNGRIYSLIVRGATSDASQIAATEAYVASKCGVVL